MGRPLAGFGFFNAEKRFDAETENFEKVKIHAFLEQDAEPSAWVANTQYNVGDKVKNGSKYYVCKTANSQSSFLAVEATPAAWKAPTLYHVGDKVSNAGSNYICKTEHTSTDDFSADSANWDAYTLITYWTEYTLGGGAIEDCKIIKQTGFNKYLVSASADENRQGIVMLVDKTDATVAGTAYITITKLADSSTKYARKIVRNIIETFDGEALAYQYDLTETDGVFAGAFNKDKTVTECYPEVFASAKSKSRKK